MTFTKSPTITHDLTDLWNISFVLAEHLRRAGIQSPDALRDLGAKAAWVALHRAGFRPSIHTLLALEGAVQNRHWPDLDIAERLSLIRFAAEHAS